MADSTTLSRAVIEGIRKKNSPIVTSYDLGVILFNLYKARGWDGKKLLLKKDFPESGDYNRVIGNIRYLGVLTLKRGFKADRVFEVLGASNATAEETMCIVDPFCYLSHFSAMDFHGLTERFPKMIHVSSPNQNDWKRFANERMKKDLGDDIDYYHLPLLQKFSVEKIDGKTIQRHSSLHLGAYKNIQDSHLRVATVGRTFLDMLKQPSLCGGMRHVLSVYRNWGMKYKPLIIKEIDRNGGQIDKVRAGYILEEICGINDELINSWTKFAQRGGSRKLSAEDEFSSEYSEKWMLSINIQSTEGLS